MNATTKKTAGSLGAAIGQVLGIEAEVTFFQVTNSPLQEKTTYGSGGVEAIISWQKREKKCLVTMTAGGRKMVMRVSFEATLSPTTRSRSTRWCHGGLNVDGIFLTGTRVDWLAKHIANLAVSLLGEDVADEVAIGDRPLTECTAVFDASIGALLTLESAENQRLQRELGKAEYRAFADSVAAWYDSLPLREAPSGSTRALPLQNIGVPCF